VLLFTLTPGSPGKPEDADGWESQSRPCAPALERKVHRMWDLCRQFVEGEGRDEADHALRDLVSNDDEVGIGKGRQVGKTEQASRERLQDASITQGIEGTGGDPQAERFRGAQRAAVLTKEGNRFSCSALFAKIVSHLDKTTYSYTYVSAILYAAPQIVKSQ
jgi:hypothetical protein